MAGYPTNGSSRVTEDLNETIREALADVTIKVDLRALRRALAKNAELSEAIAEAVILKMGPVATAEPAVSRSAFDEAMAQLHELPIATRRAVAAGTNEMATQVNALSRVIQGVSARVEALAAAPADPGPTKEELREAVARLQGQIFDLGPAVDQRIDVLKNAVVEGLASIRTDLAGQVEKVTDTVLDGFSQLDILRTELAPGPLVREVSALREDVARSAATSDRTLDTVDETVRSAVTHEVSGLLALFTAELDEHYAEAVAEREAFASEVGTLRSELAGIRETLAATDAQFERLHEDIRLLRRRISLSARSEGSGMTEEVLGRLAVETARAMRTTDQQVVPADLAHPDRSARGEAPDAGADEVSEAVPALVDSPPHAQRKR